MVGASGGGRPRPPLGPRALISTVKQRQRRGKRPPGRGGRLRSKRELRWLASSPAGAAATWLGLRMRSSLLSKVIAPGTRYLYSSNGVSRDRPRHVITVRFLSDTRTRKQARASGRPSTVNGGRVSKVEHAELFDLVLSRRSNSEALVDLLASYSNSERIRRLIDNLERAC